jgi:hypothetical protein
MQTPEEVAARVVGVRQRAWWQGYATGASTVIVIALILTSCTGCASLPYEQRTEEGVYQALHLADMMQSLDIKNHPGHHEANPILGPHPNDGQVLAYFAAEAGLHYAVTKALYDGDAPMWAQRLWQGAWIYWEADNVYTNNQHGIRFTFWQGGRGDHDGFHDPSCSAFSGSCK